MYRYALIITLLFSLGICEEKAHKKQNFDPFAIFDRHLTHSLAYHYLWPWSQLIRAVASLDVESLEDPQIISDSEKYQVNLSVRKFKPEDLKIEIENRYIIIEGKLKEQRDDKKIMANHFVQRFLLPPGTKQEEVIATIDYNGVLSITAPKHELPKPPLEKEVRNKMLPVKKPPIQTEKVDDEKQTTAPSIQTSVTHLEQVDTESTTHIGKIRKKELKTTTKTTKDNEVTKGIDGNGLDYALIDTEE